MVGRLYYPADSRFVFICCMYSQHRCIQLQFLSTNQHLSLSSQQQSSFLCPACLWTRSNPPISSPAEWLSLQKRRLGKNTRNRHSTCMLSRTRQRRLDWAKDLLQADSQLPSRQIMIVSVHAEGGYLPCTTTTLSEQNYTLNRTTLSGAELHFEQNYTLSRTTPKIQISEFRSAKTPQ